MMLPSVQGVLAIGAVLCLSSSSDAREEDPLQAAVTVTRRILSTTTRSNTNTYTNTNTNSKANAGGTSNANALHRHLADAADNDDTNEGENPMNCDGAFLGCMGNDKCGECFNSLREYEIDWASVAASTPCAEVAAFLHEEKVCESLQGDPAATTAFCQTFHSCAFWTQEERKKANDNSNNNNKKDDIDCDQLTSCTWEGMHENFIGDGICHENMGSCYNTAICDYDGGDCCQDTCKTPDDSFITCGHDGYGCRDPKSDNCDETLTLQCKKKDNDDDDSNKKKTDCAEGATPYRLVMYDSFGDGWDNTKIKIRTGSDVVFEGALKEGSQGTEFICLSNEKTCYHVDVTGGTWGKEVSWDVRGYSEGATAVAQGGAPMDCEFAVGGDACDTTCFGKPNEDPTKDPGYKEYKEMYQCIEKKCLIQVKMCGQDAECSECLQEDVKDKCHSIPEFNAVIDCTMCQCTEKKGSDFCIDKASPGQVVPGEKPSSKSEGCTPGEVLKGGSAVMDFGKCTKFDSVSLMITEFDQNNFGDLDTFESCAHAFKAREDKGGKTALECLQILVDAKDGKMQDETSGTVNKDTVAALANLIYSDGENFCNCASKSSEDCPLCPSFLHFKTLLYESLDACMALDEIDCAAWDEFYPTCKKNLESTYGTIDLAGNNGQCGYVKSGCGGAGAYPAFRRLDCAKEVDGEAWDFHNILVGACANADAPSDPTPTPPAPTPTPPAPTPAAPSGPRPYVPPEDRGKAKKDDKKDDSDKNDDDDEEKKEYHPKDDKKKSHWFRNLVLLSLFGYGGYYVYKRRSEGFSFTSYRRMHRNFGEEDMYSGLAMESSTNFEPPSLPPGPGAMGQSQYTPYSQY